ncbi:aldehyde dehydrogenase [Colletotrichum graminicola M1.001]|uniref:Aldehyde dehydrogenase n=1 Tax=Colletotrichum graminicola (strain M1.001 / M2 / FGSC 10212) TaxID=645133 RepID=E3Q823_COLGM|nr:aldehyde dehydrogenase [Colletotrichum graminicola M1.001]EFQ27035.1 aldehyde dehydrogenase [Colletotrichum graminicola M1.001]
MSISARPVASDLARRHLSLVLGLRVVAGVTRPYCRTTPPRVLIPSSANRAFATSPRRRTTNTTTTVTTELTAPNGRTWTQPIGLFINNDFVQSSNAQTLLTSNPFTEEDICSVYAATPDDVDSAVAAARAAFNHASWRRLSGTDRGYMMMKLADLVDANLETLATIETLDNGKPYSVSRDYDVPHFSEVIRYYAGYADKIHGQTMDVGPDKLAYTIKEPLGVCGQIIPWNYPLCMSAWKLGPALSCGNTIVLKLAEQTPLSMLYVAQLIKEAGFPPGVVNIINGYGREAGATLASHTGVDKVAFTGSTATSRDIMRLAAGTLKNVTLETGGKSPLIVFDDADLDQAAKWSHEGIMSNQGQVCTATSRILVHEAVYESFIAKFAATVRHISVVGDPFDEATYQGPQITRAQYDRVLAFVQSAKDEGATIALGGAPAPQPSGKGFFVQPTVFTDVTTSMRVYRDEIFGPCAAVVKFRTEEEALEMANDSVYGLGAAVFTKDLARAHRVAREVEAGMVWVNSSNDSDFRVPFGGVKQSGIGRELGEAGLLGYCNVKAVHVNLTSG